MSNDALEAFAEACAARGPLRLSVKMPGQPGAVPHLVHKPFAVIGRDARADLRLDAKQVSLLHAYLQMIDGQLVIVDLGSRSGIHGKDGPVRAEWLPPRDPVRIGPYWLRWLDESPGANPTACHDFTPLGRCSRGKPLIPVALEFLNGQRNQPWWQVDRVLTLVGNTPSCKVCLGSPGVSAFHCSLVCTESGLWVVDLLSRAGIRINGARVPCARLEDDDRVQIGEFVIRVCYGTDAARGSRETPVSTSSSPDASVPPDHEPTAPGNGRALEGAWFPGPAPMPSLPLPPSPLLPSVRAAELGPMEASAAEADGSQSILLPLISQFGAMQEQMADQFRQTMAMMFQMFTALHKDHMAFIQEEMSRLQRLTHEIHVLQLEAAKHAPGRSSTPADKPPTGTTTQAPPSAASPGASPAPDPNHREPAAKPAASGITPAARWPAAQEAHAAAAGPAGQDIHAWLTQRMTALQEERQSRWQMLLGLLTGKRPETD
jgi:pSer/pThr/pTyr-binding forkhead associated (FHA) protein